MDKTMLELFMRMFGNQTNSGFNNGCFFSQPSNSTHSNPSYSNYPHEAFTQNTSNNQQNSTPNAMAENNILPLLLSMLGKNNTSLSSIFETLSKKQTDETQEKTIDSDSDIPSPLDDEILL